MCQLKSVPGYHFRRFLGFSLVRNGKKFKDFGFLLSHYPSLYPEILTQTKIHFLQGFTMRNDDTFSLFKSHSRTFHVVFALQTCRLFKPDRSIRGGVSIQKHLTFFILVDGCSLGPTVMRTR